MIIPALDYNTLHEACETAKTISDLVPAVKVGMELFHLRGPEIFHTLRVHSKVKEIFYDGKLNDIPTTVERTLRVIARFNIWMVTVHAKGGIDMVKAAVRGASLGAHDIVDSNCINGDQARQVPKILVVGTFTSTADPFGYSIVDTTLTALGAKADGVVCHPHLAHIARRIAFDNGHSPEEFLVVCPGIRPKGVCQDDHVTTLTPLQAKRNGANYLVVGRPITQSKDPRRAVLNMLESLEG